MLSARRFNDVFKGSLVGGGGREYGDIEVLNIDVDDNRQHR
jgi:hypothetical protein